MDVLRIIGIGMIICLASIGLKGNNPQFSLLISLVGGFIILATVFGWLSQIVTYFNDFVGRLNIPMQGMAILVKCLGLSYLAKISCDTCVDSGETATATKIEFAAKVGMLLTALPLFEDLIDVIVQFSG